jgi:hypothetical protein
MGGVGAPEKRRPGYAEGAGEHVGGYFDDAFFSPTPQEHIFSRLVQRGQTKLLTYVVQARARRGGVIEMDAALTIVEVAQALYAAEKEIRDGNQSEGE